MTDSARVLPAKTPRGRPDKVVFLTTDFRPMIGGIADHLHRLAEQLAQKIPVTVMTTVRQNGSQSTRHYHLAALPALPERRLGQRFGDDLPVVRKLQTAAYFLALRRHARHTVASIGSAADGNLAVIVGLWDVASHFWCAACRRRDVPYHLMAYGLDVVAPRYGSLPQWRAADFEAAARVIAISRATADLVSDRFAVKAPPAVVNPGVSQPFDDDTIRARARELLHDLQLGCGPILLTVGRLVARKGIDLVIQSLSELRHQFSELAYLVVGDGVERGPLEALARERGVADAVRFVGEVDELTKWAAYDLGDLFVMPNRVLGGSDWEGFGIVFLEAALAGLASIGGRNGGAADAIVDGVTGLLVDPEGPGALTRAIADLIRDDTLRLRLGREAKAMAQTRFSGQAVADCLRNQLGWN